MLGRAFMSNDRAKLAIVVGALLFVPGCAPMISGSMNMSVTEGEVKEKTADYFGVSQSKVVISDYQKGLLGVTYKTSVNGKLYNCALYYGAVDCKVPGG